MLLITANTAIAEVHEFFLIGCNRPEAVNRNDHIECLLTRKQVLKMFNLERRFHPEGDGQKSFCNSKSGHSTPRLSGARLWRVRCRHLLGISIFHEFSQIHSRILVCQRLLTVLRLLSIFFLSSSILLFDLVL